MGDASISDSDKQAFQEQARAMVNQVGTGLTPGDQGRFGMNPTAYKYTPLISRLLAGVTLPGDEPMVRLYDKQTQEFVNSGGDWSKLPEYYSLSGTYYDLVDRGETAAAQSMADALFSTEVPVDVKPISDFIPVLSEGDAATFYEKYREDAIADEDKEEGLRGAANDLISEFGSVDGIVQIANETIQETPWSEMTEEQKAMMVKYGLAVEYLNGGFTSGTIREYDIPARRLPVDVPPIEPAGGQYPVQPYGPPDETLPVFEFIENRPLRQLVSMMRHDRNATRFVAKEPDSAVPREVVDVSDASIPPPPPGGSFEQTLNHYSDDPLQFVAAWYRGCLLYTSPSPRDRQKSRMPSSA